jgi:hypothetical protein
MVYIDCCVRGPLSPGLSVVPLGCLDSEVFETPTLIFGVGSFGSPSSLTPSLVLPRWATVCLRNLLGCRVISVLCEVAVSAEASHETVDQGWVLQDFVPCFPSTENKL